LSKPHPILVDIHLRTTETSRRASFEMIVVVFEVRPTKLREQQIASHRF